MTLELNMRADDAHSTQIDQKVFPLSKGELLTAPQAVFAEVLGRILAARWAAAHPSVTSVPPAVPKAADKPTEGGTDRSSQGM
jgi:hypothetical protein